ncbi:MAG: hypothetical protein COB04_05180 [Gammaproteobacteria bacterium]|nr:MAG: hypothetical protein COB04_06850 [Gammaproteobacteria bacterium]PCJ19702.1 MAG: hypothetical protein COB04_05180 [Gammaproteobacteria bacterium]
MWLKPAIVITFILLVISLGSGFVFLMKDKGKSKRTMHSLGVRVTLAAILMGLVGYGVLSGRLVSKAPWSAAGSAVTPEIQQSK